MKRYWFCITLQWSAGRANSTASYQDEVSLPDADSWNRFNAIYEKAKQRMGLTELHSPSVIFYHWEEVF